jgi:hypothetical protein
MSSGDRGASSALAMDLDPPVLLRSVKEFVATTAAARSA